MLLFFMLLLCFSFSCEKIGNFLVALLRQPLLVSSAIALLAVSLWGLSQCRMHFAGFEKPSAIQQKGIVPFTKGLDVIQQAQLGTGRIATFCAGILQNLDYNLLECQALVLAPTRELAQRLAKVMRALGDYQQVRAPFAAWIFFHQEKWFDDARWQ